MPSSTARFDCSARLSAYAPNGSNATTTPTIAAREPVNARHASRTKRARSAADRREHALAACRRAAVPPAPRSGSTTNTVTSRIIAGHEEIRGGERHDRGEEEHARAADRLADGSAAEHEAVGDAALVLGQHVDGERVDRDVLRRGERVVEEDDEGEQAELRHVVDRHRRRSASRSCRAALARIHRRRRPKRSDENASTNGPAIHLNAHGR